MPARKAVSLAVMLSLAILPQPLYAMPPSGGDTVRALYDALLSTMKEGRTLGRSGRFAQLRPVIPRTFDLLTMARLSVGPSWATVTDAQRQQMAETFGRYIAAQCSDRFDSYSGEKLEVTEEQPAPSGVIVRTRIVKASGEPVEVDYLLRQNGQSWLISDLYLDGAISEVATRRSEFAAILKRDGIDGLIAALDRKVELLTATVAKSV
jgi:phospholipid transport system substrate-binding protein